MNEGWIKLHRRLLKWEWFDNPRMIQLFIFMLLSANTEEKKWHGLTIRRGQFVTSVAKITKATGLSEQQIRTCVKHLVKTGDIIYDTSNRVTHHCVVITICNYDKYQNNSIEANETPTEPQRDCNETVTELQRDCNDTPTEPQRQLKNNKNKENNRIKEEKEEGEKRGDPSSQKDFCKFFNDEMEREGAIIPRITMLAGARRTHFEARAREHGREAINQMVRKAARSDFLNGRNGRGWKATFDWLILPANFIKVIEGAYDNIPATNANNNYIYHETLHKYRHDRRRGVDLTDVRPEDYTDKI